MKKFFDKKPTVTDEDFVRWVNDKESHARCEKRFSERHGVKRATWAEFSRMIKDKQKKRQHKYINPPFADHLSLWLKDRKPHIFVSQPYGQLDADDMKKLMNHAEEHDLDVSVSGSSWWYPGSTILIMWRVRE